MTQKVPELNTQEFNTKVGYFDQKGNWKYVPDLPTLVYFFGERCPQCERVKPQVEEAAKKWQDRILFFQVKTELNPELVRHFRIRGIPAFLFLAADKKPLITFGFMSEAELSQALQEKLIQEGPRL